MSASYILFYCYLYSITMTITITYYSITITYIVWFILLLVYINISFLSLFCLKSPLSEISSSFSVNGQHVELLHLLNVVLCLAGPLFLFSSLLDYPLLLKEKHLLSFSCCTQFAGCVSSHVCVKVAAFLATLLG